MERRGFDGGVAPVNIGEEIDVKIEAVGEKGDGIAKKKGFVLFIPNTKEGDEVRVRITRVLKKVGFAEVVGQAQGKGQSAEKAPKEKKEDDLIPVGDDSEDFGEEAAEEIEEKTEEDLVEEVAESEEDKEELEEAMEEEKEEELEADEAPAPSEDELDIDEPPKSK
ncbi:MAG: TRAM domain-containing protein [Candidatus Woesearchaeota archaeon]